MPNETKENKAAEEAAAKLEAEEAAAKKLEEELAASKLTVDDKKLVKEAKQLGVTGSRISMGGFSNTNPGKKAAEEERQKINATKRLANRVAKAKAADKLTLFDKRRGLLASRLKQIKDKRTPNRTPKETVAEWIKELKLMDGKGGEKIWNVRTSNGTKPFTKPKKATGVDAELADMDLD